MKSRLLLYVLALAVSSKLFGVIELGQTVPNLCWTDVNETTLCLDDKLQTVRVLIYGTGWCPGCNSEMAELAPRAKEFKDKPVVFISLSSEGYSKQSPPDTNFLKQWKAQHRIPFDVAASPKDAGKLFFAPPNYIPNVVVIDKANKLAYKAVMPSIDTLFAEIRKQLK